MSDIETRLLDTGLACKAAAQLVADMRIEARAAANMRKALRQPGDGAARRHCVDGKICETAGACEVHAVRCFRFD